MRPSQPPSTPSTEDLLADSSHPQREGLTAWGSGSGDPTPLGAWREGGNNSPMRSQLPGSLLLCSDTEGKRDRKEAKPIASPKLQSLAHMSYKKKDFPLGQQSRDDSKSFL